MRVENTTKKEEEEGEERTFRPSSFPSRALIARHRPRLARVYSWQTLSSFKKAPVEKSTLFARRRITAHRR